MNTTNMYGIENTLFCLLIFLSMSELACSYNCQQGVNCHLPDCFCSTFEHPMDRTDIPQMVYFGFDDALDTVQAPFYDFLFRENRVNPNGCPIGITLYVSDTSTDYDVVNEYYKRNYEFGVHSVSHTATDSREKVFKEASEQRNNLVIRGRIPKEEITGWRSPNLLTAGDGQVEALKELGFTYDISLSYAKQTMDGKDPWPFTLDHGWPFKGCSSQCPKRKHKGFWQVPVNPMIHQKFPCIYVDGCSIKTNNAEQSYKFLMDNFRNNYYGNRAPFGLNMHSAWFWIKHNMEAMDRAVHDMLEHGDVYIITVQQVLEWMKHPTKLSELKKFAPWGCISLHKSSQRVKTENGYTVMTYSGSTRSEIRTTIVVSLCVATIFWFFFNV